MVVVVDACCLAVSCTAQDYYSLYGKPSKLQAFPICRMWVHKKGTHNISSISLYVHDCMFPTTLFIHGMCLSCVDSALKPFHRSRVYSIDALILPTHKYLKNVLPQFCFHC